MAQRGIRKGDSKLSVFPDSGSGWLFGRKYLNPFDRLFREWVGLARQPGQCATGSLDPTYFGDCEQCAATIEKRLENESYRVNRDVFLRYVTHEESGKPAEEQSKLFRCLSKCSEDIEDDTPGAAGGKTKAEKLVGASRLHSPQPPAPYTAQPAVKRGDLNAGCPLWGDVRIF